MAVLQDPRSVPHLELATILRSLAHGKDAASDVSAVSSGVQHQPAVDAP
jgi:hypothetical protein